MRKDHFNEGQNAKQTQHKKVQFAKGSHGSVSHHVEREGLVIGRKEPRLGLSHRLIGKDETQKIDLCGK